MSSQLNRSTARTHCMRSTPRSRQASARGFLMRSRTSVDDHSEGPAGCWALTVIAKPSARTTVLRKLRKTSGPRGCTRLRARYLLTDAEPSRKERGHRGVRPRHPNRDAKSKPGKVPQAARNRVVFVQARGRTNGDARCWRLDRRRLCVPDRTRCEPDDLDHVARAPHGSQHGRRFLTRPYVYRGACARTGLVFSAQF